MPTVQKPSPIYTCPACQGNNKQCVQCAGIGRFLRLDGKIYYWGKKYSLMRVGEARLAIKARSWINSAFFLFGLAGFICLLKVLYDLEQIKSGSFYNFIYVRNEFTLVFWLSMLINLYLIYRISREAKIKYFIKKRPRFNLKTNTNGQFDWNKFKQYKRIDISKNFDQASLKIMEEGWLFANKLKHAKFDAIHLLTALLGDHLINLVFTRLGINRDQLLEKIKHGLQRITESGNAALSAELNEILLESYLRAREERKSKAQTTDLLYALAHHQGIAKEILYDLAITEKEISQVTAWVDLQKKLINQWHTFKYKAYFKPKNNMNRAYTAVATPNLNQISRDMTLFARAGAYSPCIGREKEIDEIFRVLGIEQRGVVLVGQPGVGKKTIIEGIAELMTAEDVPKILRDKRLVSLSVSGLIAGAARIGEMEQRVITIMNEISRSKNIVLVIEDIHHLVGVTAVSGETMDMAEVVAEQMRERNFLVIATAAPTAYQDHLANSNLAKVLEKVIINEPDEHLSMLILEARALELESKHRVYFSYQAIAETLAWTSRYLPDEYLPEKAINILAETAAAVRQMRGEKAIIAKDDIANIISSKTNIPLADIVRDEKEKLLNLEQRIHERVIGQEQAVKFVSAALRRARTELRDQNRPMASFLFLGPTGVGKTEVAKTLAEVYFGSAKNMIRVDMSEYQSGDALTKLIGHAGTNKGGYLTEAVRNHPFSLILLDEVEKATFDILNVFLQVLEDGRLTDATGKTIDFTNTIIIATSNAGADYIKDQLKAGMGIEVIRENLINQYLKDYFRPELLNRFDGIAVFHPLEIEQVRQIAKLFLNKLGARLEEKGITLKAEETAVDKLAELGYDPAMGARPLRRVIQDQIEDQLAKLFLAGQVERRDTVILGSDLVIKVNKAQAL